MGTKEIPFIVVINPDGELVGIEDTRKEKGRKRAKLFLSRKRLKTSGITANLLWDTAGYVFGLDNKGNNKRAVLQKKAFTDRLINELGDIPVIQTLIHFLQNI